MPLNDEGLDDIRHGSIERTPRVTIFRETHSGNSGDSPKICSKRRNDHAKTLACQHNCIIISRMQCHSSGTYAPLSFLSSFQNGVKQSESIARENKIRFKNFWISCMFMVTGR